MYELVSVLSMICSIAILIGLIKPQVLRLSLFNTRLRVIAIGIPILIILMALLGSVVPEEVIINSKKDD